VWGPVILPLKSLYFPYDYPRFIYELVAAFLKRCILFLLDKSAQAQEDKAKFECNSLLPSELANWCKRKLVSINTHSFNKLAWAKLNDTGVLLGSKAFTGSTYNPYNFFKTR